MRFFNTHLADLLSLSKVPILIGSLKLFSTAIWVCFSGRPTVTSEALLRDLTKNGASNQRTIQSLWLDLELSNTLLFFSILKISYFSPIPKGPFWFLQTQVPPLFGFAGFLIGSLYWLPGSWCVSSQFSRETNSNTPRIDDFLQIPSSQRQPLEA